MSLERDTPHVLYFPSAPNKGYRITGQEKYKQGKE